VQECLKPSEANFVRFTLFTFDLKCTFLFFWINRGIERGERPTLYNYEHQGPNNTHNYWKLAYTTTITLCIKLDTIWVYVHHWLSVVFKSIVFIIVEACAILRRDTFCWAHPQVGLLNALLLFCAVFSAVVWIESIQPVLDELRRSVVSLSPTIQYQYDDGVHGS